MAMAAALGEGGGHGWKISAGRSRSVTYARYNIIKRARETERERRRVREGVTLTFVVTWGGQFKDLGSSRRGVGSLIHTTEANPKAPRDGK
jgi:hypothetical protein